MATIHKIGKRTFKYERKRINEEIPSVKLSSMKWFLWTTGYPEWEYLGYFDSKKAAIAYAEMVYKKEV